MLQTIPSLIAGNAVVIKPSEVVPLSSGTVVKQLMAGFQARWPDPCPPTCTTSQ